MAYVVDRHPKKYSPMSMVGKVMLEGYKCEMWPYLDSTQKSI
jgi:hypothetical protein